MAYEALLTSPAMIGGIVILSIWSMIWKGIGMWKAGRQNQMAWFVFMLILNTAGILPIIYLVGFQKKGNKVKKKRK